MQQFHDGVLEGLHAFDSTVASGCRQLPRVVDLRLRELEASEVMRTPLKDPSVGLSRKRQSSSISPSRNLKHKKHQIRFNTSAPLQNVLGATSEVEDGRLVPTVADAHNLNKIEAIDTHSIAHGGSLRISLARGAAISRPPDHRSNADGAISSPTTSVESSSLPVATGSPRAEPSTATKPPPKNNAELLMPLTEAQSYEDMQTLYSALTVKIRSIVQPTKGRAVKRDCASENWPCQKVVTWLLFQTLNTPGAKNLGHLLQYTYTHEDWRSHMKFRAQRTSEQPEGDEPVHFRRLTRPSASASVPAIAHTPLAILVKCQEELQQYECLEEMRALLKPGCKGTTAANKLRTYLDRTQPANAKYGNKLHAQIAHKLGLTVNAVYRNHRWGQRLKCLCDLIGPGIVTLFGSNAMKV